MLASAKSWIPSTLHFLLYSYVLGSLLSPADQIQSSPAGDFYRWMALPTCQLPDSRWWVGMAWGKWPPTAVVGVCGKWSLRGLFDNLLPHHLELVLILASWPHDYKHRWVNVGFTFLFGDAFGCGEYKVCVCVCVRAQFLSIFNLAFFQCSLLL